MDDEGSARILNAIASHPIEAASVLGFAWLAWKLGIALPVPRAAPSEPTAACAVCRVERGKHAAPYPCGA